MPGSDGATIQSTCKAKTGLSTVPNIWINGKFFGDSSKLVATHKDGKLMGIIG